MHGMNETTVIWFSWKIKNTVIIISLFCPLSSGHQIRHPHSLFTFSLLIACSGDVREYPAYFCIVVSRGHSRVWLMGAICRVGPCWQYVFRLTFGLESLGLPSVGQYSRFAAKVSLVAVSVLTCVTNVFKWLFNRRFRRPRFIFPMRWNNWHHCGPLTRKESLEMLPFTEQSRLTRRRKQGY